METIAKFIKAIFFTEEGEADKSAVKKFKDAILLIMLGAGLMVGALFFLAEDDEDSDAIECVTEAE